jgi:hypothetical protein
MPSGRQVHIDSPMSNLLVASFETMGDFVAQSLFPVVSVGKQSDKYYTLSKEAWLKQPNSRRSPRTAANRIEFDISSDAYFADNYALAGEIPVEDMANADTALALRKSTTAMIARNLLADLEIRTAAAVASNVSTIQRLTGANAWDAVNSADIQSQVQDAHISIFNNTGLRANVLVLDYQSYLYAKRNKALIGLYQYTSSKPSMINDAQLAEAFSVDRVLVARSQKNNAAYGATASITSIWGPTAILARVEAGAPSMMTATYGLSFRWTAPDLGAPMAVTSKLENDAGSRHIEILEGGYHQDEKVIASALGFMINTKSGTPW